MSSRSAMRTIGRLLAATAALTLIPAIPWHKYETALAARSVHVVILKGELFQPQRITISRNDSVRWVWRDGLIVHNVVGSGFRSRTTNRGSFTVRFTRSGVFHYRCTVHPAMRATIIVR